MEVKTKTMGTLSVDEKNIIEFPNGVLGFEDFHRYALIESEYKPFYWMQSLDEAGLAFLIVDPFIIAEKYELDVDDKTLSEIDVESAADVIVWAIVTVLLTEVLSQQTFRDLSSSTKRITLPSR